MELTPKQITDASNYWGKFRKLPIGNAEMIMHLATYANEVLHNNTTNPNGVVANMIKECNDDDEGWMYCPNCGRVKIEE